MSMGIIYMQDGEIYFGLPRQGRGARQDNTATAQGSKSEKRGLSLRRYRNFPFWNYGENCIGFLSGEISKSPSFSNPSL